MCGRFELQTKFDKLPKILKQDYPRGLDTNYETRDLIRPNDPVLVIKNDGKIKTTFMTWGFISPWTKYPFDKKNPKPFNARSETVDKKKLFSESWKYRRCLIPASGFFENCCVITTEPNVLIKPFHNRMPVVVPNGYEEEWTEQLKETDKLKDLSSIFLGWSHEGWICEKANDKPADQLTLF